MKSQETKAKVGVALAGQVTGIVNQQARSERVESVKTLWWCFNSEMVLFDYTVLHTSLTGPWLYTCI